MERLTEISKPDFEGYSLHELQQRRVLLLVQRELVQEKLQNEAHAVRERLKLRNIIGDRKMPILNRTLTACTSLLNNGSAVIRYVTMAVSAVGVGRTVYGWFNKKKK